MAISKAVSAKPLLCLFGTNVYFNVLIGICQRRQKLQFTPFWGKSFWWNGTEEHNLRRL